MVRRPGDDGDSVEGSDRGQALTLEAVTAAIVILAAIGFALQMTAVTPLSASTSSQHVENQLQSTSEGVLASTAHSGALSDAVLYYNTSEGQFHNAGLESYYRSPPSGPLAFFDVTRETYSDRSIAYNVIVHYREDGTMKSHRLIYQGEPSDHAVSASRTVPLTMDDHVLDEDGSEDLTLREVLASEDDEFYVSQSTEDDEIYYNLVHVEVVAWRI